MACFVKLNENNTVIDSVVVADDIATTESAGVTYLQNLCNNTCTWKQTYKDGTRKNYAGIGFVYDETRNAFYAPSPYPSWVLKEDNCSWHPPVDYPADGRTTMNGEGKKYIWDEDNAQWKEIE